MAEQQAGVIPPEEVPEAVPDVSPEALPDVPPKSPWYHKRLVVAAVAVLVVAAGSAGGYLFWDHQQTTQSVERCEQSVVELDKVTPVPGKVADDTSVKAAVAVTVDQVADAKTVATLKTAVQEYSQLTPKVSCSASSRDEAMDAADSAQAAVTERKKALSAVRSAVRGVEASRALKILQTAKSGLQDKISAAQQVLASSEGKVADNATRDTLQAAITAAQKVANDTSVKDAKQYTTAADSLQAPLQAVNDSVAKKTADDTAAAQAAQAQAAPTLPYTGYTPQRVPQYQQAAVPQYQPTPAGGGGSALQDMLNRPSSGDMPCQVVGTCK